MKKIQLSLDELKVESFETAPSAEKRQGTVIAFESGEIDPTCDLSCITCSPSCQPTCGIVPGADPARPEPPWCL